MQLFDDAGRYSGMPQPLASPCVSLEQPEIEYADVLTSAYSSFPPPDPTRPVGPMYPEELAARADAIMRRLRSNPSVSNILNGVHLPLLLPQLPSRHYGSRWDRLWGRSNDYGTLLRDIFMPAVKKSHWLAYPERQFVNWLEKLLSHELTIAPESRHDRVVEQMSKGYVVGIFFPMALLGFSALDCRQLMAMLPENFALSGGFDLATALTCYPKVLARDVKTPELTMAALNWRSCPDLIVSIKTWGGALSMTNEADVSFELSAFSAGLLVIEDGAL